MDKLRERIDSIDDEIAKLFLDRMAQSKQIAIVKKKENVSLENVGREKSILTRIADSAPSDMQLYLKQFFENIFEISKAYQRSFLDLKSNVKELVTSKVESGEKEFPKSATVACQGVAGSFSSLASDKIFPIASNVFFKDFSAVFNAVEKGLCNFGVLPIENSLTGSISAVYDLIRRHNFYIAKAIKLPIKHCLLAPHGVNLQDIKIVYSHEQAINQCADYLKKLGDVELRACENTATAAKLLAKSKESGTACIASRECGALYGLKTLVSNIQNNDLNYTRFIAIAKDFEIYKGARKISIMVDLPHEAGSLNKLLNKFSAMNFNLTKIESRPIANSPFEFSFYFDFEADIFDAGALNLLSELEVSSDCFTFLGSYDEI